MRNLAVHGHIGCELVDVDLAHLLAGVAQVCGERAQHVARADLVLAAGIDVDGGLGWQEPAAGSRCQLVQRVPDGWRSEEHTSELQSQSNLVCRLLLEKKKKTNISFNNAYILY